MPTDSSQLAGFISRVEGQSHDLEYVANDGDGLLVMANRNENNNLSQIIHRCDVLDKEFFRYDLPMGGKTVDNRDAMHKRGWTYFKIAGQINGKQVQGTGRIPFVYAMSQEYYPWLNLKIAGAKIEDASSFVGLLRPWMGLHTIDTVRRDAAKQGIWFETRLLPDSAKAEVTLTHSQAKLVYAIDTETDVIERITFLSDADEVIGQLEFSYMQNIKTVGNKFAEPRKKNYRQSPKSRSQMLWLFKLMK